LGSKMVVDVGRDIGRCVFAPRGKLCTTWIGRPAWNSVMPTFCQSAITSLTTATFFRYCRANLVHTTDHEAVRRVVSTGTAVRAQIVHVLIGRGVGSRGPVDIVEQHAPGIGPSTGARSSLGGMANEFPSFKRPLTPAYCGYGRRGCTLPGPQRSIPSCHD